MNLGVWGVFDLGSLLLHLFGICFVAAFIWGMDFAFIRSEHGHRVVLGRVMMCIAGTGLIYAFLYDSMLLPVFETKGMLLIMFGGFSLFHLIEIWRNNR